MGTIMSVRLLKKWDPQRPNPTSLLNYRSTDQIRIGTRLIYGIHSPYQIKKITFYNLAHQFMVLILNIRGFLQNLGQDLSPRGPGGDWLTDTGFVQRIKTLKNIPDRNTTYISNMLPTVDKIRTHILSTHCRPDTLQKVPLRWTWPVRNLNKVKK